ncbi:MULTISPECIES: glycosyltransferase [unclassified Crossiella]|uniref:glycosyltransferase n=1 Tax=unclassified Crossiella TaxID=2620835 RepID=UPI002000149F|nr:MULTISPECIES: nucleotide disphospho-sugar-binding domain-containing protein [unclassified Crossiella]MCK2241329.1 DUF1205 domain-containing protein [Crossiella sp. S99.2]MCK2253527.1 DUF1205 domain-containing protein [Crossiella sp. S99.1]
MRFLFITGGGSAPVHAGIPLAWTARTAGHEVIVACPEENRDLIAHVGLPAYAVTPVGIADAMLKDRAGDPLPIPEDFTAQLDFIGRGFGRLSAAAHQETLALAKTWKPDVIIGGEYNHHAQLVAHQLGLPLVSHTYALYDRAEADWQGATDELAPELSALSLSALPEAELFVDITPPSLRPDDAVPARLMRWTPGNQQVGLERWMCAKGDKPRVVITSGSRSKFVPALGADFFRPLLANPALSDGSVEVVIATTEPVAQQLRAEFPDIKAGWVPLDVVAPTADLVVHHGGGVTVMTLLNAGVPQVVLPEIPTSAVSVRRVDERGAAITLDGNNPPVAEVAGAITKILGDSGYRASAQEISREIAGLTPSAEIVKEIEQLV